MADLTQLKQAIANCSECEPHLALGARPVVQFSKQSKILIAGQAPGLKVHQTGIAFNDPSGDRLRDWLGVSRDEFYNADNFALLPMGFCYPGKGKSGDLPPRKECAKNWREKLLAQLSNVQLTLAVGQYAIAYHLPNRDMNLTEMVQNWKLMPTNIMPLPHPSSRNNIWLKRNPWFEQQLIPELKAKIINILNSP